METKVMSPVDAVARAMKSFYLGALPIGNDRTQIAWIWGIVRRAGDDAEISRHASEHEALAECDRLNARAALEALRDNVSEGMVRAYNSNKGVNGGPVHLFKAMIAAALKEYDDAKA